MNRNKKTDENGLPDITGIFDIDESKIPKKPIKPDKDQSEIESPILTAYDDIHSLPEEEQKKIKKENKKKEKEKKLSRAKTRLILILIAIIALLLIIAAVRFFVIDYKKPEVTYIKPEIGTIEQYYRSVDAVTFSDGNGFEVMFADNEYDIHSIEEGLTAEITIDSNVIPGTVKTIQEEAPDSDIIEKFYKILTKKKPETSVYTVIVTPEQNEIITEEGKKVTVKIITKKADRAVIVPDDAIMTADNQTYVWLYDPAGEVTKRRDIKTGINADGKREVTKGLTEDDLVVTEYSCKKDEIYDGMKVRVK